MQWEAYFFRRINISPKLHPQAKSRPGKSQREGESAVKLRVTLNWVRLMLPCSRSIPEFTPVDLLLIYPHVDKSRIWTKHTWGSFN